LKFSKNKEKIYFLVKSPNPVINDILLETLKKPIFHIILNFFNKKTISRKPKYT